VKPAAWSHSALETFENCPKQYHETKVLKKYPFEDTKEVVWGREVHRHFEHRLLYGTPLPVDLQAHEEFLAWFASLPGQLAGEERIALDVDLKPCEYFDKRKQVWYRGQVDARKRNGTESYILDHKTGKVKNDYTQLKSFAIYEFLARPEIQTVRAEYYWTQLKASNGETYTRAQLPDLIAEFVPKLNRFADAYATNNWIPKQSGLCNGWCPVTTCEFWRPKRKPRS
jgi:PD-(D/E)XK nuclease superfamily